jgi:hypothetical protein
MILILLAFHFFHHAEAHIVGVDPWCIANSPVHYECFYLNEKDCNQAAKKKTDMFEKWQCLSFPMDFRNFPKNGEGTSVPQKK